MTARRDPRILLQNIETAAVRIGNYIDGVDLATYVADSGLQDQLERNFITIGEALNQLSRVAPQMADRFPEAGDIIGFRHVLVHDYEQVEAAAVWDFAVNELPPVLRVTRLLLAELGRAADIGRNVPGAENEKNAGSATGRPTE